MCTLLSRLKLRYWNHPPADLYKLDPIDFGRRVAVEKELRVDAEAPRPSLTFDASGNFVLYPTLLGVKVVNLVTNRVVKVIGKVENTERFLKIALYQGRGGTRRPLRIPVGSDAQKQTTGDPTLVCSAYRKERFYLFTQREPSEEEEAATGRDVLNERPTGAGEVGAGELAMGSLLDLPRGAIIHTTFGDIWVKLFPDEVSQRQRAPSPSFRSMRSLKLTCTLRSCAWSAP